MKLLSTYIEIISVLVDVEGWEFQQSGKALVTATRDNHYARHWPAWRPTLECFCSFALEIWEQKAREQEVCRDAERAGRSELIVFVSFVICKKE